MNPFPFLFFVAVMVVAGLVLTANHAAEVESLNERGCVWTGGFFMKSRPRRARFEYDCGGSLEWSSVEPSDVKARKR